GAVHFRGELLARPGAEPPPEARNFGFVFQDHVLFPHLTVAANVAFGLAGLPAAERESRVTEQLAQVGLAAFADRYPHTLSGGQQQRVALARALAPRPGLMLLDEPFASVDSTLRRRLREDARRTLKDSGVPSIVVTHDPEEAMELADRIAVIRDGRIVQDAAPAEVWHQPADRFVAELFSDTDAISGVATDAAIETAFGSFPLPEQKGSGNSEITAGAAVEVIVRPGGVHVAADSGSQARVVDVRFLGGRYLVVLEQQGERLRTISETLPPFKSGDAVTVTFASEGLLVYVCE
ncbi:MAG: ABC transporter ATP-binding protein, partial [Pseudomonadota bacterium]